MANLNFFERHLLPDYRNVDHVTWAEVSVDVAKCSGCGICVKACPANSLHLAYGKARMNPVRGAVTSEPGISQCIGCGDCVAICPNGSLTLCRPCRWTKFFKTIDRGPLAPPRR